MTHVTLTGRDALARGGEPQLLEVDVRDGVITDLRRTPGCGPDQPWIAPGLVDLQVNGHGEGDANAALPHADHIRAMARSLSEHGVCRFLPTVITASQDDMIARIRAVVDARRDPLAGQMVAGIHVEGPSLSPEDGPRGVHPREHLRPPSVEEVDRWLDAAEGLLRIVTLSPHYATAVEVTRHLVSHGVRVAIGHTHADDEQIRAVAEAGASLSTHLGNGAHAMLPRHPNYLWSQLAEPRLAAGLIADGHHLPDATLLAMLAAKRTTDSARHGAFLVSDVVATPDSLLRGGMSTVGGEVEIAPDGALRHRSTGFLAGSIDAIDVGVATVARLTGSLPDALDLASIAPATILDGVNPWRIGARADVLQFRWSPGDTRIEPVRVHVAGREI